MINLLPEDRKRDLRAARMNVVLLRYNFMTLGAIGLLGVFCLLFYLFLYSSQSAAQTTSVNNQSQAQAFKNVEIEATDYRNNLTIANSILSRSRSYTEIILEITNLLPSGVILQGISLNSNEFGQQTAFQASAKSFDKAVELKTKFQKSKVFSNVYFQTIANPDQGKSQDPYPLKVNFSAKISQDAGK